MNRITVLGNLCADAEKFDVETRNGNSSYVSFFVADYGTPTKKGDPLTLEVHFSKDVALKLLLDFHLYLKFYLYFLQLNCVYLQITFYHRMFL